MTQEKKPTGASRVTVTPAQHKLLEFCNHQEANALAQDVKSIHDLGTYFTDRDMVNLDSSYHVRELYELLAEIGREEQSNCKLH